MRDPGKEVKSSRRPMDFHRHVYFFFLSIFNTPVFRVPQVPPRAACQIETSQRDENKLFVLLAWNQLNSVIFRHTLRKGDRCDKAAISFSSCLSETVGCNYPVNIPYLASYEQ